MDKKQNDIPIGRFKQQCLAIVAEVARSHRPVVITKRGKPLARLAPLDSELEIEERILAVLRQGEGGMLVAEEDFLAPSSELAEWKEK